MTTQEPTLVPCRWCTASSELGAVTIGGEDRITGSSASDSAGHSLVGRDLDSDGLADLLVGSPTADS